MQSATAHDHTTDMVKDKQAITKVLENQAAAWTNGDMEGYMQGYWNSEELKFYGSSGLTKGWKQTLANYKKKYPSKDHTGTLKFKIIDISPISTGAYSVMGE